VVVGEGPPPRGCAATWVTDEGRIALLDAGAVGRLDACQRHGLQMALLALALRDHHRLAEALMTITSPGERFPEEGLADALAPVVARLGPCATAKVELFVTFTRVLQDFGLALEPVILGANPGAGFHPGGNRAARTRPGSAGRSGCRLHQRAGDPTMSRHDGEARPPSTPAPARTRLDVGAAT
jgi:hypothetical protein